MPTPAPLIGLYWRSEAYGSICAVSAFRNYVGTANWTKEHHRRFRACIKRAGYAFNPERGSFICDSGTAPERQALLCSELLKAGFSISYGNVLEPLWQ